MKVYRGAIVLFILALVVTAAAVAQAPPPLNVIKWDYPPRFKNVTINVVGDAGHNLKPYEFWKERLRKGRASRSRSSRCPFEGVYEKEKTEFVAGTGAFDVVTFYPAYIGDFAGNGYLAPLDNYMKKTPGGGLGPQPGGRPGTLLGAVLQVRRKGVRPADRRRRAHAAVPQGPDRQPAGEGGLQGQVQEGTEGAGDLAGLAGHRQVLHPQEGRRSWPARCWTGISTAPPSSASAGSASPGS